jgi:hypothetical protein
LLEKKDATKRTVGCGVLFAVLPEAIYRRAVTHLLVRKYVT